MKQIGIIGAGTIGIGVAYEFASFGFSVTLIDLNDDILNDAENEILRNSKLYQILDKSNKSRHCGESILKRITFSTHINDLKNVVMVIENVTEDLGIKKGIYKEINKICSHACIFAVNTSCISITKIQSFVDHPARVIGTHFMNPVPLKGTVEVIKGFYTSEDTIENTLNILETCNKKGIVVNDMPGFVSNRVLMLSINEAIFLIQDNVSTAKDIDDIFCNCFGHKMGPIATGDLIGLDTILRSLIVLYESYNDPKYRPAPLLVKMVDAGLLGKKTKEGFYKY